MKSPVQQMPSVRHRQSGQAIALAAVAMIAIVGAVAFVIDTGFFFEGRRELQLAADNAAEGGVVFLPQCNVAADGAVCVSAPGRPNNAQDMAVQLLKDNGPIARQLCGHPTSSVDFTQAINTGATPGVDITPGKYTPDPADPTSYYYTLTVTIRCSPGFSLGKIIMGNATQPVSASATAVVGSVGSASCAAPLDVVSFPPPPYGTATVDNNFGYLPGLDFGLPIQLDTSVQSYVGGGPYGTCADCGNLLEVCLDPGNCGGPDIRTWFAGQTCISLDTSVGQNLTGSPGNTLGPVISGLGERGYLTSANNATCRDNLTDIVDTSTWKVTNNSSPCLIQIAILDYDQAFYSTGRSTFKIVGFATIFLQAVDGNTKIFTGVFVQSTAPGKVLSFRDNATHATRLIR
jgi:hypothetical protein